MKGLCTLSTLSDTMCGSVLLKQSNMNAYGVSGKACMVSRAAAWPGQQGTVARRSMLGRR